MVPRPSPLVAHFPFTASTRTRRWCPRCWINAWALRTRRRAGDSVGRLGRTSSAPSCVWKSLRRRGGCADDFDFRAGRLRGREFVALPHAVPASISRSSGAQQERPEKYPSLKQELLQDGARVPRSRRAHAQALRAGGRKDMTRPRAQSAGLGQEIRPAPRGQPPARQRINGNMLVKAGHMRCGQPPDVRVCAPDEPAALLHQPARRGTSPPCERLTGRRRIFYMRSRPRHPQLLEGRRRR